MPVAADTFHFYTELCFADPLPAMRAYGATSPMISLICPSCGTVIRFFRKR